MATKFGWWKIGGTNIQARYGYGSEREADLVCDAFNSGKSANLIGAEYLGDSPELDAKYIMDSIALDLEAANILDCLRQRAKRAEGVRSQLLDACKAALKYAPNEAEAHRLRMAINAAKGDVL